MNNIRSFVQMMEMWFNRKFGWFFTNGTKAGRNA